LVTVCGDVDVNSRKTCSFTARAATVAAVLPSKYVVVLDVV
jgi:hypothetical protein